MYCVGVHTRVSKVSHSALAIYSSLIERVRSAYIAVISCACTILDLHSASFLQSFNPLYSIVVRLRPYPDLTL